MRKIVTFTICLAVIVAVLVPFAACAETTTALSTTSREAILMSDDGQVLYESIATAYWQYDEDYDVAVRIRRNRRRQSRLRRRRCSKQQGGIYGRFAGVFGC